jgi:ribosomal protein L31
VHKKRIIPITHSLDLPNTLYAVDQLHLFAVSGDSGQTAIVCPSCSTSTALASVITAIATALLAIVIFVLVQIAICKCHPKFTPGGAETGTSAGGERQEYEQMEGGVAKTGEQVYELIDDGRKTTSGPTYMEVGGGGGNTFQLKGNEAYASTTH